MSTRSAIGYPTDNGFKLIYCHYDGYPGHVGKLLREKFDSLEHAKDLTEGHAIRCFYDTGVIERFDDGEAFFAESVQEGINGFDYLYFYDAEKAGWRCFGQRIGSVVEISL